MCCQSYTRSYGIPWTMLNLGPTVNTSRPRQNGRHFTDDIFKCIFLNENVWIPIKISLKFVPHGPINNIPALVQIMAWRRPGDKPLSEAMMVRLLTHICVTRPQWVNSSPPGQNGRHFADDCHIRRTFQKPKWSKIRWLATLQVKIKLCKVWKAKLTFI